MRWLLLVLALAACGSPSHPLVYVQPSDPIWALNPDKWNPPGGNMLTTPPAPQSGRMTQAQQ